MARARWWVGARVADGDSWRGRTARQVIVSAQYAKDRGLKPLARIRGYADAAQLPIKFPTSPAKAVPIALKRAGLRLSDIECAARATCCCRAADARAHSYHEINEAFAVVALANIKVHAARPAVLVYVRGIGTSLAVFVLGSSCWASTRSAST